MILYVEDLGNKRDEIIDKAVEELTLFIDCKEYLEDTEIDLKVASNTGEYEEEDYLFYTFSIWRELYKARPDMLLFLNNITLMEIFLCFNKFCGAMGSELFKHACDKARENGVEDDFIAYKSMEIKYMLRGEEAV